MFHTSPPLAFGALSKFRASGEVILRGKSGSCQGSGGGRRDENLGSIGVDAGGIAGCGFGGMAGLFGKQDGEGDEYSDEGSYGQGQCEAVDITTPAACGGFG